MLGHIHNRKAVRTERQLGTWVLKQIPVWVEKLLKERNSGNYAPQRNKKQLMSSIADHLIMTGYVVNRATLFKIICMHQNPRFFMFAMPTAIALGRPFLCKQNELTTPFEIPMWEQRACRMKL